MFSGQGQERLPFQLTVLSAIIVSAFYNFSSNCFVTQLIYNLVYFESRFNLHLLTK